jgi:hypothetical protein
MIGKGMPMKKWRMIIDIGMTAVLLGLMAYSLIVEYLFLRTHFVFFDDSEPLIFFFIDYLAIMGLFVFIGHYLAGWLKRLDKKGSIK